MNLIPMFTMIAKKTSFFLTFAAVLLLHATYSADLTRGRGGSQKADPGKFRHAVARSDDAGRIITMIAVLPDMTIPKELMERAEAVGVFPKVVRETALFLHESKGYGVISARQGTGWTLPAFYQFGGGGYGSPFAGNDAHAVILLFMKKDAVSWFEKGRVQLKNDRKATEGPVGGISDVQRRELEDAQVIAYAYYNGRLNGTAFGTSFWKAFGLNPDNNINNPVYGMKGREVLAGRQIDPATVLPGITSFQDALTKYYARS
jgi:lipid-binding SYLF domain-containing protein